MEKLPKLIYGVEVPTKEEFFKKKYEGKKTKNTKKSERYAEAFLKAINCNVHRGDGKKEYERNGGLTPDFVIFKDILRENHPDDFYVDVNEVIGGAYHLKRKVLDKTGTLNPFREESIKTHNNMGYIHKIPLNFNLDEEFRGELYNPFITKRKKYGDRRSSGKFGLISVQGFENTPDYMKCFYTLLNENFDAIIGSLIKLGFKKDDVQKIKRLKIDVLSGRKRGLLTFYLPFEEKNWCFWAMLGSVSLKGTCIMIINSNVLKSLEGSMEYEWLMSLKESNIEFIEQLENELKNLNEV